MTLIFKNIHYYVKTKLNARDNIIMNYIPKIFHMPRNAELDIGLLIQREQSQHDDLLHHNLGKISLEKINQSNFIEEELPRRT